MAEAIGTASGLLTLVIFAYDSSKKLCNAVKSFKSHQQRVREFINELNDLSGVLNSLANFTNAHPDLDIPPLKLPLRRCGDICQEFERELLRCLSRSGVERTSFRDWAKLRYMDEDVDGFRRMLASYKMTINIALADASLRRSSAAVENMEAYTDMINTTRADLEDRLERMDEKLGRLLERRAVQSGQDLLEVENAKEERSSTEQCLQICAQLSDHITKIQATAAEARGAKEDDPDDVDSVPGRITLEGLQQCKEDLARTAVRLASYEREVLGRLIEKSMKALTTEEDRSDLTRLQDEWEATRLGVDICSSAHEHLRETSSTIENYATGDAMQVMVSTNEKTIYGKNRGLGWRTRQIGGHMSNEALQEITRTLAGAGLAIHQPQAQSESSIPDVNEDQNESTLKFKDQYGRGFKLSPRRSDLSTTELGMDRSKTAREK